MRNLWLPLLGLAMLLGGACGDSDPDLTSYTELLRFVPDEPEFRESITITDHAALRALPLPDDAKEEGDLTPLQELQFQLREYVGLHLTAPFGARAATAYPEIEGNWNRYLGLSVDEIDHSLVSTQLLESLGIVTGHFDAEATVSGIERCADCAQPEANEYEGVKYYDWGERLGAGGRLQPPVYDNLGRGGQYRFEDDYIVRTIDNASMVQAIDAETNSGSVLEQPHFRALAKAIDDLEARDGFEILAVTFTDWHQGPELVGPLTEGDLIPLRQAAVDASSAAGLLEPYAAYALAGGLRDGEQVMALVLAHDSTEGAQANEAQLLHRLDKTTTWDGLGWDAVYESWTLEVDGPVLIALLEGEARWSIPHLGEPLIFHE